MSDWDLGGSFLEGYTGAQDAKRQALIDHSNQLLQQSKQQLAQQGIHIKELAEQAKESYNKGSLDQRAVNEQGRDKRAEQLQAGKDTALNVKAQQFYSRLNQRTQHDVQQTVARLVSPGGGGFKADDALRIAMEAHTGTSMDKMQPDDIDKHNQSAMGAGATTATNQTLGQAIGAPQLPSVPVPGQSMQAAGGGVDPSQLSPQMPTAQGPQGQPIFNQMSPQLVPAGATAPAAGNPSPAAQAAPNTIASLQQQIAQPIVAPPQQGVPQDQQWPQAQQPQQGQMNSMPAIQSPMAVSRIALQGEQAKGVAARANLADQKATTEAATRDSRVALEKAQVHHLSSLDDFISWRKMNGDAVRQDLSKYRTAMQATAAARTAATIAIQQQRANGYDDRTSWMKSKDEVGLLLRAKNQLRSGWNDMGKQIRSMNDELTTVMGMNGSAEPDPVSDPKGNALWKLYNTKVGPNGETAGQVRAYDLQKQLNEMTPEYNQMSKDYQDTRAILMQHNQVLNSKGQVDRKATSQLQKAGAAAQQSATKQVSASATTGQGQPKTATKSAPISQRSTADLMKRLGEIGSQFK